MHTPIGSLAGVNANGRFELSPISHSPNALAPIRVGFESLRSSPFTCRKAGQNPFLRELIIPFGRSGYVALFEIVGKNEVVVATVRHQLEEDYD